MGADSDRPGLPGLEPAGDWPTDMGEADVRGRGRPGRIGSGRSGNSAVRGRGHRCVFLNDVRHHARALMLNDFFELVDDVHRMGEAVVVRTRRRREQRRILGYPSL